MFLLEHKWLLLQLGITGLKSKFELKKISKLEKNGKVTSVVAVPLQNQE